MLIKSVIRYVNGSVRIMHDISIFSLMDVLGGNDGTTDIIIGVDHDGLMRYFNLSKLIAIQPVLYNDVSSWESLEVYINKLNNQLLEAVEVSVMVPATFMTKQDDKLVSIVNPYLSNSSKQLRIYSGDNDNRINLEYGSVYFPTITNNQTIRHLLSDVIVTTDYSSNKLNLRNTLPIINGVVCYPEVSDDGTILYARDGVPFTRNRKQFATNTVLVDFSDIGDIECIRLSDCTQIGDILGHNTVNISQDKIVHGNLLEESATGSFIGSDLSSTEVFNRQNITFTFDTPKDKVGIPIVVLFGRMITPMEQRVTYHTVEDRLRITCSISRHILENILISNREKEGKHEYGTSFYRSYLTKNLDKLFKVNDKHDHSEIFKDAEEEYISHLIDGATSFVCLIKSDKKIHFSVKEHTYRCNDKILWFASENPVGGILINPNTLEIVDYTRVNYSNGALITFFEQSPLFTIYNDNFKENTMDRFIVERKPKGIDTNLFEDIRRNTNLVLIDIQIDEPEDEIPVIPPDTEPETVTPSGSYKDNLEDPIIPAKTRLVVGSLASVGVASLNNKVIRISGTDGLDGDYERINLFSKFNEAIWYCRNQGDVYQLYCEDNFWYIGEVDNEPKYRSSDNNGVLMPWNTSFIKWFTLESEIIDTADSSVTSIPNIKIAYTSETSIYISSNYPGIIGQYTLDPNAGLFESRKWVKDDCSVYYQDYTWCVARGDKIIYQSEEAMSSSSPWHHLEWNYLGE